MTVFIMLKTSTYIRLIHGSVLVLEVVNSSISEADTCWPALLLLFCFQAVRQAEGRRKGGQDV